MRYLKWVIILKLWKNNETTQNAFDTDFWYSDIWFTDCIFIVEIEFVFK